MGAVVVESYWMNYVQYEVGCRTVTHTVSVRVQRLLNWSVFLSPPPILWDAVAFCFHLCQCMHSGRAIREWLAVGQLLDFQRYELSFACFSGTTNSLCLQCFDAVGWAAGRASGL